MVDFRGIRLRRRRGRATAQRWQPVLALVIALLAIVTAAYLFRIPAPSTPVAHQAASLGSDGVAFISSGIPSRANYRYSVIPGGAGDAEELTRAVKRDPVVAEHYRGIDPATMRTETLAADRLAYVSYRVDDRVYWTKRKVRIRSGETILTNGQVEVRSRCGNCISLEPMLPTSANEPDESQFDALTDMGPTLVSWNLGPSGVPLAVSAPPGDPDDTVAVGSSPIPVIPLGVAIFSGGPITNVPTDNPPGILPPGVLPDLPPAGTTTPPGGVTVPGGGESPGNQLSGGDSELPFVVDALLSDDANPAAPSTPSSQPTPIPEPGTFLLLGSGIAGVLVRRWRLKRT